MSDSKGWAGKGLLGCGALLLLLCTANCLFWGFHVFLDQGGNISDDEALPGLIGAVFCGFVSLALAVVGLVLVLRKTPEPGAAPDQGAFRNPTAPVAPAVKGPFPTHFVAGCVSLVMVVLSCVAFGGGGYFYDRVESAEMFEEFAYEDQIRYGTNYGLGPDYWRREADERRQLMFGSLCCGGFFLLLFFAGVVGAVVLLRRNQAKSAELAVAASGPDPASAAGGFTPPPPG